MPVGTIKKAVSEKYAIGLTYKAPDLAAGETISTVTVAITPAGLTAVGAPSIDGLSVYQIVEGGASGVDYSVLFKVTTSAGYIYNHPDKEAILVKVR